MSLTSSRITHIITSLEKKGYIERQIDKKDSRNIQIKLHTEFKIFVHDMEKQHIQLHEEIFKQIPLDKREVLVIALHDMFSAIEAWATNNIKKKNNK